MQREIKFRAWALYSREMFFPSDEFFLSEGKLDPIPNTILMQYTGLKDKNGKEIYEGDIVDAQIGNEYGSWSSQQVSVVWHQDATCFAIKHPTEDLHASIGRDVVIIGNIYENPELLK